MTVTLHEARSPEQRGVVERLWQLYAHDLSAFRGTRPDAAGRFGPGRLPAYFEEAAREVHLVALDGDPVGFTMVRPLGPDAGSGAGGHVLGEFFVVRAVRRLGVGRTAALHTVARHRSRWELAFQEANPAAARFWRRVADDAAAELGAHSWEERRPVPGKPEVPPDTWLVLDLTGPPPPRTSRSPASGAGGRPG